MTSTRRQAEVLEELGLARAPMTRLLSADHRDFDHDLVSRLLAALKARTKPPRARVLGMIGRDHIRARFESIDVIPESFEYRKLLDLHDGLPQVTEIAFTALKDQRLGRRLITGVNWSAAWINPFRQIGPGYYNSLDSIMESRRFSRDQPVVLLLHVAHPRVQYADRGKSTVVTT